MSIATDGYHLSDAELLRILDARGPEPGIPDAKTHLETCDPCADALAALQADSRLVARFLRLADFEDAGSPRAIAADDAWRTTPTGPAATPTPGRLPAPASPVSPWLKAAAILVLVAAPLAAFPDVRSWVVDQVAAPPTAVETAPDAVADSPTVLRFTPDPGDFVVRFEAGSAGTIALERTADSEAELRIVGGQPETVVSASALEIGGAATARYRLRLPADVTGVWVMAGERAVAVSDDQIDRRTVVDLGR